MHFIENDTLKISVKTTGAELCSIVSQSTGREYMWQADESVWANHAPVLFPIVGGLKNGEYVFEGKTYSLPKHGLVRHNDKVVLVEQTDNSLVFKLESDADSLLQYPFSFVFLVGFHLEDGQLTVSHEVHNKDDKALYFSLGGHPAFRCPWQADESYEDYYLQFEKNEKLATWMLNSDGLVAEQGPVMLDDACELALHKGLFDNDALIFKQHHSTSATLKSRHSDAALSVSYPDWPYLGIWAKPGAPFVCIEPWKGIADSVNTNQQLVDKEGIMALPAGEVYRASYVISISE